MPFELKSNYQPLGDQPQAIDALVQGINSSRTDQILLGVTGSGKTFTIASVVEKVNKPTLVIAHNKTLAAQLYQEFRDFFPQNAVSYFVSYYDFYQPEAYLPQTDTYIEKETEINEEIDKLRLQATTNLLTRSDVIVVASVSAIYGLGNPVEFGRFILELDRSKPISRSEILLRLVELQYDRSDFGFHRGTFRVKGDTIDLFPAYEDFGLRIELLENEIKSLRKIDPLTGEKTEELDRTVIYPAKHYMTDPATYADVFSQIRRDLEAMVKDLKKQEKELEAHRLNQRVNYDLEMIQEVGYVNGIENYSRYFDHRSPGDPPYTLMDYFPKDYLLVIDESHMTIPQIRGMYNGDRSRKEVLVNFGFRLPAALDNRPLRFDEFLRRKGQTIYVSATPDDWEKNQSEGVIVEQLIRPTGIVDPEVEIRPTEGQIQDLLEEIKKRVEKKQRVLVTTLTKRMAEELTDYLKDLKLGEAPVKVAYLHSDIQTLERSSILKKLRLGEHDVLVGINLLREGLDLPEVGLVAILDADKEGFLRSDVSLVQTMGRAARNVDSRVILYADTKTASMTRAIDEVTRRRKYQLDWNKKHNITPQTISKPIREDVLNETTGDKTRPKRLVGNYAILLDSEIADLNPEELLPEQRSELKKVLERRMKEAAKILDFEGATFYRDYLKKLS